MSPKLVPACFVDQFLRDPGSNNAVELKTNNLDPVRDFISITDVVSAIYTMITAGESGKSYNISSGAGLSIREIIGLIARTTSTPRYTVIEDTTPDKRNTITYSVGDNSKLKDLGWICTSTVEEGVKNLVTTWKGTRG